jgi:hypothetical protein
MPRVPLLFVIQVASILGSLLLVLKLIRSGLYRRYPFFFSFCLIRIPYFIIVLLIDVRSDTYFFVWLAGNPVYWILYFLIVRELVGLILEKYSGLKNLGRWFMYGSMGVSLIVSILSILPKINPTISARSQVMGYVFAIDRGVTASLAVFLVVLLALLSRYPVRLQRNLVVHSFLFTTFFIANSLTMLMRGLFGVRVFDSVDVAFNVVGSACGFAWFWLLSAKGEEVTVHVHKVDSRREEALLSQLNYLNETLLKTRKS